MSMVYNEMLVKKQQLEKMEQRGQNKYEYDSDEDIEVRLDWMQTRLVFFAWLQVGPPPHGAPSRVHKPVWTGFVIVIPNMYC